MKIIVSANDAETGANRIVSLQKHLLRDEDAVKLLQKWQQAFSINRSGCQCHIGILLKNI